MRRNQNCWQGYKETGLVHCGWKCNLIQLLWKTACHFLKLELKLEFLYDPAIPPNVCSRNESSCPNKGLHMNIHGGVIQRNNPASTNCLEWGVKYRSIQWGKGCYSAIQRRTLARTKNTKRKKPFAKATCHTILFRVKHTEWANLLALPVTLNTDEWSDESADGLPRVTQAGLKLLIRSLWPPKNLKNIR